MRRSRDAPRSSTFQPARTCCKGIGHRLQAEELPHRQQLFPGTTAWRISYNRRQVVEGVNGMLKGGFVNIQHKFFRVFGLTKTKLLLAFTVVGYNLEAIRSFLAKKAAKASHAPRRTRGRGRSAARERGRRSSDHLIGRQPIRPGSGPRAASDLTPTSRMPPVLDQGRHRHVSVTSFVLSSRLIA